MAKKKVLILANTFFPILGGVETHLIRLIEELARENTLEVHLIAYTYINDQNNPYNREYKGVRINLLPIAARNPKGLINRLELTFYPFYFVYTMVPLFIYTFFYCLKTPRFDVIHANSHTTGGVALLIARIFGIRRKYISIHGVMFSKFKNFRRYWLYRTRIKKQFEKFDRIFCIGQRSFCEIRELLGNDHNLEIFRYWVDDSFFVNDSKFKSEKNSQKTVFYAGRLVKTKGVLILLKIAHEMSQFQFLIAGDGELKDRVVKESKVATNIKYLGRLDHQELSHYYKMAAISVLFAQGDGEGIPISLIESVASGTPILATSRGGTKELVDFGVGLITENSQKQMKEKIKKMLTNEKLYKEKRRNCFMVARKYFSKQNARVFINNYLN